MYATLFMIWVPFVAVMVAEHYILTRMYEKPSSLQRIFCRPNESAKTDLSVWGFYYLGIPALKVLGLVLPVFGILVSLVALPGLLYLAVSFITEYVTWHGFFHDLIPSSGVWAFLIWLFAHDLALYCSHVLMHRVPWLWRFHKLHHAATEMDVLTGTRVSLGEHALNELAIFVLLNIVIGIPRPETIFYVMLVRRVIDLIQHSDLPFGYGWLGYVIASPRFHRMHHSSEACDHDANYGNIFSLWDYLFRTVALRYRTSPTLADTCPLGLDSAPETAQINGNWITAVAQATLFDDLASAWRALNAKKSVASAPVRQAEEHA